MLGLGQAALGEIGQLQVVEKDIQELLAGEDKTKRVLALAFAGLLGPAAALVRTRQQVALDELLVAGEHVVAHPALAAAKARLVHPVKRNADLAALQHV